MTMAESEHLIPLNDDEYNVVLNSLNDKRTELLQTGHPTDAVDDTLLTVIDKDMQKKKGLFRRAAR